MSKSLEVQFKEWFESNFGYGYGSGEEPMLRSLRIFFGACFYDDDDPKQEGYPRYQYTTLEELLGKPLAWFLINKFCENDIINYGSSPRFGWVENRGKRLKKFFEERSINELLEIVFEDNEKELCTEQYCFCDADGEHIDGKCKNNVFMNEDINK